MSSKDKFIEHNKSLIDNYITHMGEGSCSASIYLRLRINPLLMKAILLSSALIFIACMAHSATIYVDIDATGSNDGTSWANAFQDLQSGIDASSDGDDIWVAEGVYTPSLTDVDETFSIAYKEIELFGGFNATETSRNQRNWSINKTILNGEIGDLTDITDNIQQLVQCTINPGEAVTIDGFILRRSYQSFGGPCAIYHLGGNLTISNCEFKTNYNTSSSAIISSNNSEFLTISNSLFHGNEAGFSIIALTNTDAEFSHLTMADNTLTGVVGTINSALSDWTLYNSILYGNDVPSSDIPSYTGGDEIKNCLIEFLPEEIQADTAMISTVNPQFNDASGGDFTLSTESPAIEFGNNALSIGNFDLGKNDRKVGAYADAGCYEYQNNPVIYVNKNAFGNNDGTSWFHAFNELTDALAAANEENQIWVAQGTYYPTDDDNRAATFFLQDGCPIYGGFLGVEQEFENRNWITNHTILSGDIGTVGDMNDNSYTVLFSNSATEDVIVDGFEITGGWANDIGNGVTTGSIFQVGTGDPVTIDFKNNFVHDNFAYEGGHMFFTPGYDVKISNCIFSENLSTGTNGIIVSTSPLKIESTFFGNNGTPANLILAFDNSVMRNCTFYGVSSDGEVPILEVPDGETNTVHRWYNCLVAGNPGATLFSEPSGDFEVVNCLLDEEIPYASWDGGMNLITDPNFIDPANNDFNLLDNSPAINAADETFINLETDMFGSERSKEGGADIGAFESSHSDPCELEVTEVFNNICVPLDETFLVAFLLSTPNTELAYNGQWIFNELDTVTNYANEDAAYITEFSDLGLDQFDLNVTMTDYHCSATFEDFWSPPHACHIIHVDSDANGANNGDSWTNAYTNIQDALENSYDQAEIWIAEGEYYPSETDDPLETLMIEHSIEIYGGFNGTETSIEDRDHVANPTIISGNIGDPTMNEDNSQTIFTISSITTKLYGLTIIEGFDDANDEEGGSAIKLIENGYCSLFDCTFENHFNRTGPLLDNGLFGHFDAYRCNFKSNSGGTTVVMETGSGSEIEYCLFYDNAIIDSPEPTPSILILNGSTSVDRCTFVDNNASDTEMTSSVVRSIGGSSYVYQSIFNSNDGFDNAYAEDDIGGFGGTVNYCNSDQPISEEVNVLNEVFGDPAFADMSNQDYQLTASSVCIDQALLVVSSSETDLAGNPSIVGNYGDLGCFEYQDVVVLGCPGDYNQDNFINADDLLTFLSAFGCTSDCGLVDLNGDDAVNAEDLLTFLSVFGEMCP